MGFCHHCLMRWGRGRIESAQVGMWRNGRCTSVQCRKHNRIPAREGGPRIPAREGGPSLHRSSQFSDSSLRISAASSSEAGRWYSGEAEVLEARLTVELEAWSRRAKQRRLLWGQFWKEQEAPREEALEGSSPLELSGEAGALQVLPASSATIQPKKRPTPRPRSVYSIPAPVKEEPVRQEPVNEEPVKFEPVKEALEGSSLLELSGLQALPVPSARVRPSPASASTLAKTMGDVLDSLKGSPSQSGSPADDATKSVEFEPLIFEPLKEEIIDDTDDFEPVISDPYM